MVCISNSKGCSSAGNISDMLYKSEVRGCNKKDNTSQILCNTYRANAVVVVTFIPIHHINTWSDLVLCDNEAKNIKRKEHKNKQQQKNKTKHNNQYQY